MFTWIRKFVFILTATALLLQTKGRVRVCLLKQLTKKLTLLTWLLFLESVDSFVLLDLISSRCCRASHNVNSILLPLCRLSQAAVITYDRCISLEHQLWAVHLHEAVLASRGPRCC